MTAYAAPPEEIMSAVIEFANQDPDTSTLDAELTFSRFASLNWKTISPEHLARAPQNPDPRPPHEQLGFKSEELAERHGQDEFQWYRKRLKTLLDRAIKQEPDFEQLIGPRLREKVHPVADLCNGQLVILYQVDGVEAGIAIGLALMVDTGAVNRLRRCEDCESFFLLQDGRQHSALYCAECRLDAQRRATAERQQRLRDRKKLRRDAPDLAKRVDAGKLTLEAALTAYRKREQKRGN